MPVQLDEQLTVPPQPSGIAAWHELPHDVLGTQLTTFTCTAVVDVMLQPMPVTRMSKDCCTPEVSHTWSSPPLP